MATNDDTRTQAIEYIQQIPESGLPELIETMAIIKQFYETQDAYVPPPPPAPLPTIKATALPVINSSRTAPPIVVGMDDDYPDDELTATLERERQLRAFVEGFVAEAPRDWAAYDNHWRSKWYDFAEEATALLASLDAGDKKESHE